MFETNQLYLLQDKITKICELQSASFKGMTKLNLFTASVNKSEKLVDQQQFDQLLKRWSENFSNEVLLFSKQEAQDAEQVLSYWNIYGDKKTIEKWLAIEIKSSKFDFLLWPEKHLTPPKLLVFDMDSTFIQIEVIDELARLHGVGKSVSKVTEAAMRGELDFSESLISRVACLEGLAESTIDIIANNLPLSKGVVQLVEQCKTHDIKVAIVSGGFTPFVEHLKDTMDLYQVKANHLVVQDGKLTGKLAGRIVDAKMKANFVNELSEKLGIKKSDILAIGDGANDLLMMHECGFSLAYRAKPTVQEQAGGRMNTTCLNDLSVLFNW